MFITNEHGFISIFNLIIMTFIYSIGFDKSTTFILVILLITIHMIEMVYIVNAKVRGENGSI